MSVELVVIRTFVTNEQVDEGQQIFLDDDVFLKELEKGFNDTPVVDSGEEDDKGRPVFVPYRDPITGMKRPNAAVINHCAVVKIPYDVAEKYLDFLTEGGMSKEAVDDIAGKLQVVGMTPKLRPRTEAPGEQPEAAHPSLGQGSSEPTDDELREEAKALKIRSAHMMKRETLEEAIKAEKERLASLPVASGAGGTTG
jgi:hypothetical protein